MKNLPIEIMSRERIYLQPRHAMAGYYYLADEDEVDMEKATNVRTALDRDGYEYTVFRYTCADRINRAMCLPFEQEPDISSEDYAEWCAASCGTTYNAYIGKPWLD